MSGGIFNIYYESCYLKLQVNTLQELIQNNEDVNLDLIKKLDFAENSILAQNKLIENYKIKTADLEANCAILSR